MRWIFSACLAASFLGLSLEHNTMFEGYDLSLSGYHLCPEAKIVTISKVISYKISYSKSVPCGGWLPWRTCLRTLYKVAYKTVVYQVTKNTTRCCDGYEQVGSYCALSLDQAAVFTAKPGSCPKEVTTRNCQCKWDTDCSSSQKCCPHEGISYCTDAEPAGGERGWYLNMTIVVKANFTELKSLPNAILNHTRLLQAMVTGALGPLNVSVHHTHCHPDGPFRVSTNLLIGSSQPLPLQSTKDQLHVLLKRVEEVTHTEVKDVDECSCDVLNNCSPDAKCFNTEGSYNCSCKPGFVDISPNITGQYCKGEMSVGQKENSTEAPYDMTTTPCTANGTIDNVTSSSPVTSLVTMTPQTVPSMSTASPEAPVAVRVLRAVARLTNIPFQEAFRDISSKEYLNLTASIKREILASLPPDIQKLVATGAVDIRIRSLSPGSVVVNFTIEAKENISQDFRNVSQSIMAGLQNSSVYDVDSSRIEDVDECAENTDDCSSSANCTNTWGSYFCVCLEGFIDKNPARPGRTCAERHSTLATVSGTTPYPKTTTSAITTTTTTATTPTTITTTTPTTTTSAITTTTTTTATPTTITTPTTTATATTPTTTATATTPTTITTATTPTTTTTTTPTTTPRTSTTVISQASTISMTPAPITSPVGAITVECRASEISITVSKTFLSSKAIAESSLYLGKPECGVNNDNGSHIQLTARWDQCGTQLLQHNDSQNSVQITLFSNGTSGSLIPKARLEIPVVCKYWNKVIVSAGYPSGYHWFTGKIEGSGSFHVTVRLLNGSEPLPQNYSLSPNEEVVAKVSINSSMDKIKLLINQCWATPSNDSSDKTAVYFLKNSCPVANTSTRVLENGNSSASRLAIRIFSVVQQNVVYLHCKVQICFETPDATCRPDCTSRTTKPRNILGRSDASYGPICRITTWSDDDVIMKSFQEVIFIIVGVAVAALIVGILAVVCYRKRRVAHYNFNFTPKQEKFSYNVFHT